MGERNPFDRRTEDGRTNSEKRALLKTVYDSVGLRKRFPARDLPEEIFKGNNIGRFSEDATAQCELIDDEKPPRIRIFIYDAAKAYKHQSSPIVDVIEYAFDGPLAEEMQSLERQRKDGEWDTFQTWQDAVAQAPEGEIQPDHQDALCPPSMDWDLDGEHSVFLERVGERTKFSYHINQPDGTSRLKDIAEFTLPMSREEWDESFGRWV